MAGRIKAEEAAARKRPRRTLRALRNVARERSIESMPGLWLMAASWGVALLLLAWAQSRLRRHGGDERVPRCAIGSLRPGRYRVVGIVRATEAVASAIDGALCAYLRNVSYRSMGGAVPVSRAVAVDESAFPFDIDDGSGTLRVDPRDVELDAALVEEDGGFTTERRIRDGEEVELVATFSAPTATCTGPYRAAAGATTLVADCARRARLSFRTEHGMPLPPDEVAWAIRGVALLLMTTSALFTTAALALHR